MKEPIGRHRLDDTVRRVAFVHIHSGQLLLNEVLPAAGKPARL